MIRWSLSSPFIGLLFALPLAALGVPVAPPLGGALPQEAAASATVGDDHVVAWRERTPAAAFLRMRFLRYGQPDGPVIEFFNAPFVSPPELASNGTVVIAVWSTDRQLLARRFDRSGRPLDGEPLLIHRWGGEVVVHGISVASDGRDFVAAWLENDAVRAAQITEAGMSQTVATLAEIPPRVGDEYVRFWDERNALSIAWAGDRYVIPWVQEKRFGIISATGVESREVRMVHLEPDAMTPGAEISTARGLKEPRIAVGDGIMAIFADLPYPQSQVVLLVDVATGIPVARHIIPGAIEREWFAGPMIEWHDDAFVFSWRDIDGTYLGTLPIRGVPSIARLTNSPAASPLVLRSPSRVQVLVPEVQVLVLYDAADFTPLPPRGRGRLASR